MLIISHTIHTSHAQRKNKSSPQRTPICVLVIGIHEPFCAGNARGVGTTLVQQISTPHTVN